MTPARPPRPDRNPALKNDLPCQSQREASYECSLAYGADKGKMCQDQFDMYRKCMRGVKEEAERKRGLAKE